MTINGHLETAEEHSTGARTTPAKAMPAYEQIKRYVIARIEEGVWKPGGLIPSEAELVKEFGVARMTVSRALRELTTERVQAERGWISVPDGPGLGVTLNEDFVRKYLVAESR